MSYTPAAAAVSDALGFEALVMLRLALRQAAYHDLLGDSRDFAILYRRLGGEAEITNKSQEEQEASQ